MPPMPTRGSGPAPAAGELERLRGGTDRRGLVGRGRGHRLLRRCDGVARRRDGLSAERRSVHRRRDRPAAAHRHRGGGLRVLRRRPHPAGGRAGRVPPLPPVQLRGCRGRRQGRPVHRLQARRSEFPYEHLGAVGLRRLSSHRRRLRLGPAPPGTRLQHCDLTGADFSKGSLDGVSLHGSTLDGVRGGESFRGAVIGSDQVLPLAFSVFSALGIRIDDDPPW